MATELSSFAELKKAAPTGARHRRSPPPIARRKSTRRAAPMPRAGARTPSPASGSSPAPARSPSTAATRRSTSRARRSRWSSSSRSTSRSAASQFDVIATVSGGGLSGQAGAVRHGISQALAKYEPDLRGAMKAERLPDPRQPRRRAQEVRPRRRAPPLPVLQALSRRFGIEIEGRREAPFFLRYCELCRSSPWGLSGAGVSSDPRGRRRYIKILVLQECFHGRYALRIVALLAIKTCGDARVIAGAIGILAATCAVAIEI